MVSCFRSTGGPAAFIKRIALCAALLCIAGATTGCWLFAAANRVRGTEVKAQYDGLADKSVAIVIYADQATTDEFTENRKELSSFIASQLRQHLPTTRLLNPQEVINWQDDTINWWGLTEKDIGKHFSVDRVLYIELINYSAKMGGGYGDLQGHLRANCKVVAMEAPGSGVVWNNVVDVVFPEHGPIASAKVDELAVRARTLQIFAEELVNRFYDHREYDGIKKDR